MYVYDNYIGGTPSLYVRNTRGLARRGKQTRETRMTMHDTYIPGMYSYEYDVCTSISPHTYCYNRVSYKMIYSGDACSTFFLSYEIKKAKNPAERGRKGRHTKYMHVMNRPGLALLAL